VSPSEADQRAGIARVADAIYRDKVRRARAQDPVRKLLDGFALFESGLALTKLDVARTIGTSDETAVGEALQRRFERVRQMRAAALYRAAECAPVAHLPE
jgi:hypothetical protein